MNTAEAAQPTFRFDERLIQTIVDRIPPDARGHYPDHIFQPQRIEIARELVLKEYYKLFPMLEAANFDQVSSSILYWLHGAGYELAPVSDFWNYIDGTMLTLKLKDVIPQVTSANIDWNLEAVDPRKLRLVAPVGNLAEHGKPPYDYEFINQRILQNAQQMVINRRISDEKSSDTVVSRDHYPVLVRREPDGSLYLLDGNRRTLRALLYGRTTIDAWVGTTKAGPRLQDHWVNTGLLMRLLGEYIESGTPEVKASIQSQLKIILGSSSIARYHFQTRCLPHYPFAAELVDQ